MLEKLRRSSDQKYVPLHPLLLPPASGALGGALLGGLMLWPFLANRWRVAWWPQSRWQMALVAALVGSSIGVLIGFRNWQRWHGRKNFADRNSLFYCRKITDDCVNRLQVALNRSGRISLVNAIHGPLAEGVTVLADDLYHTRSGSDSSDSTVRRHLFCFEAEGLALPQFALQPDGMLLTMMSRMIGVEDLDFDDHPEFSRRYHLSGTSPASVRQLFQHELLEFFDNHRRWEVRGEKNLVTMVFHRGIGTAAQFKALYAEATLIFELLVSAGSQLSGMEPPVRQSVETAREHTGFLSSFIASGRVTKADVRELFAETPPRVVPLRMTGTRLSGSSFATFFGGFMILFGLMCGALGLLFLQSPNPTIVPFLLGGGVLTAGSVVVMLSLSYRRNRLSLFREGHHATGMVEAVERTSVSVNDQVRFRVRIKFKCLGSTEVATIAMYGVAAEQAIAAMDESREIHLLFDPEDVRRIVTELELITDVPLRI